MGFEPTCPALHRTSRFRVDPVTATSVPLLLIGSPAMPAHSKKSPENLRAFPGKNAADNFESMIQAGEVCQVYSTTNCSTFWIRSSINQSLNASMDHGPQTHDTWFKGDIERTSRQPIVAHNPRGLAQRQYFRMGRRIRQTPGSIMSSAQHMAGTGHHHSPHRNFPDRRGKPGMLQGHFHIKFMDAHA